MDLGLDDVKKYFESITSMIESYTEKNMIWFFAGAGLFIFACLFLFLKMFV